MAEEERTSDPGGDEASEVRTGRVAIFYVVIAVVVAVGVSLSISAGDGKETAPPLAGGYALSEDSDTACLGETFSLIQSGQFLNLSNSDETLSGKLRLEEDEATGDDEITGDANCLEGGTQEMDATVAGGEIAGTVGSERFTANFETNPPAPGTQTPRPPDNLIGEFRLAPASTCIGQRLELEGSDTEVEVVWLDNDYGELHYAEDGTVTGELTCSEGGEVEVTGTATDRTINLLLTPAEGSDPPPPIPETGEKLVATEQRELAKTIAVFFVALTVIMVVARIFGAAAVKIKQPRVMGEVIAGITLGPTVFGAIAPDIQRLLFPSDIIPVIGIVANLGLIFYMFIVGLELDWGQLKGRVSQAAVISNASVALPMVLGMAVAVPIYEVIAPDIEYLPFALFMGVAMSITAFPVLARILVEKRMLKRPLGALTMAAAAVDDVTAWFLIALATAIALSGGAAGEVFETVGLALLFCLVMFIGVRPLLKRMSGSYQEVGRVPSGWIAAIFAGILLSAWATETIGIAVIFGAFVMGMVMPRHAGLTEDVTNRMEDFVITLLLPLFFTFTGLRTDIGLLDRPELWLITLALIGIAILAKFGAAAAAARVSGFSWRGSAVIGTLMNTRGLTELIVLNLALETGVISQALFAALVIMALVTTFMAGPILGLLDPRNTYGAPVSEELDAAREQSQTDFPTLTIPERAILVAPQAPESWDQLRALAEPMSQFEPPRELILADLVLPSRGAAAGARTGQQTETRKLAEASRDVHKARDELVGKGIAARGVAFISPDPGRDLSEIAGAEPVDLLLTDGRRPLLGDAVPRGPVGTVLNDAPCDVAVLVAKENQPVPVPGGAVVVPFGAAEHDWAALELGGWLCAALGVPLKLLGAANGDRAKLEQSLADAGTLVRSYAGIEAEPVIIEQGRSAILSESTDAGLLVIGLSARWQQEGLGTTRSHIARTAEIPVLFVRRGTRPGALAPPEDVTRFSWSSPGMSLGGLGGLGTPPSQPSD